MFAAVTVCAGDPPAGKTDSVARLLREASLAILKEGNARYVSGRLQHPNLDGARRTNTVVEGQEPFATILACSDSRAPVELIFDRGVGDLFVVRVAGNVAGISETATVEYGVPDVLPGYSVVGLRGWDDLILIDEGGHAHTIPAVPIDPSWLAESELPALGNPEADERFAGKVKWYVQPLVFGGSPTADDNTTWITPAKHREFARYWNSLYRKRKESGV